MVIAGSLHEKPAPVTFDHAAVAVTLPHASCVSVSMPSCSTPVNRWGTHWSCEVNEVACKGAFFPQAWKPVITLRHECACSKYTKGCKRPSQTIVLHVAEGLPTRFGTLREFDIGVWLRCSYMHPTGREAWGEVGGTSWGIFRLDD